MHPLDFPVKSGTAIAVPAVPVAPPMYLR